MDQGLYQQKIALFRKRFGAREDAFGAKHTYMKTELDPETGVITHKETSSIYRQCENYGNQTLCLIAQNKGGCVSCSNKIDAKLTDSWVWKHISGTQDLILYLLQENGIKFGACDFDRGTPFEDALMIKKYSVETLGLPAYIARSSKKGYHLYWFFTECVPAHLFTSMVRHIFSNTGIYTRNMDNPEAFLIPEVFPKQTNFIGDKYGNGIKIPMIEPKMKVGFNCWVDDEAKPYPFEEQWERLKACKEITLDQLNAVIAQHQIKVISAPVNRSQPKTKMVEGPNGIQIEAPVEPWKPRKTGDFNKVVLGCPALARFWEKAADGTYKFDKTANANGVPHTVRLASLTYALGTANGIDILKKRWNTDKTKAAIDGAIAGGGYLPITCGWLQNNGVCIKGTHPKVNGTHCFEKIPPKEVHNGQVRVNPQNLPESEWHEPSPIRLAHERPKMTAQEIENAFTELFGKPTKDEDFEDQFQSLMKAVKRLPSDEQPALIKLIKTHKWVSTKEIKQAENAAAKEIKKEIAHDRLAAAGGDQLEWNNIVYFIENGGYVRQMTDDKGVPRTKQLTNFTVNILEEMFELESVPEGDTTAKKRDNKDVYFRCSLNINNQENGFTVKGDSWLRGADSFFGEIVKVAGASAFGDRRDWIDILYCVTQFSEGTKTVRRRTGDIGHTKMNGKECYLMPSVIISKEGISENKEIDVVVDYPEARKIDFKILSDEEFKDLALHIVNDYFNCNASIAAMTTFAHAMASAIMPRIPISKSPILFITGDPGCGKSFIAEVGQCFFGDFGSNFASSRSSIKGMYKLTHVFRHALVLCDDFKSILAGVNANGIVDFIQSVYDRSVKHALKRDGKFRDAPPSARGLSIITAQDIPEKEDSAISRLILIHLNDRRALNLKKGEAVKERKKDYPGFLPHFLHYIFNTSQEHITEVFKKYVEKFSRLTKAKTLEDDIEGSPRIAENLALNMTAFHLAMECLYAKGVIDIGQQEMLTRQHETSLEIVRKGLYRYVSSQKGVTVFLETVEEVLSDPSKYHIVNFPNTPYLEHKNSKPIGVYDPAHPDVFFLYTGPAYSAVNEEMKRRNHRLHPQTTIGKQLFSDGHLVKELVDASDASSSKQIKGPNGTRIRAWPLKLSAIGYTAPAKKDTKTQTA